MVVHYLMLPHNAVMFWNVATSNSRETVHLSTWDALRGPLSRLGATLCQVYREPLYV